MSPRPGFFGRLWLPALLASALPIACSEQQQAPPDRLLVVDGIEVTFAELEPYLQFFASFMPEGGQKVRIHQILDDHLLPLRLAQRAFPEQRRQLLGQAQALCAVATNAHELDEQSRAIEDKSRRNLTRRNRLPVVMFLFAPENTGAVSPPIEVPFGYVVTAAFDLKQAARLVDDYVDALQVGFATHSSDDWKLWLEDEKRRIATKVTYVHPDYREAMPSWLQLPRLP